MVPQIGGRIIQLRLGGKDFLYVNPRHAGRVYRPEENDFAAGWKNYGGSKVWPAPQGWSGNNQWPGPPDPTLDGGSYTLQIAEESPDTSAIYLESPQDDYTGLTFAREIRVFRDSSAVRIRHEMRNTSARPVRWAIWQVTQQAAGPELRVFAPAKTHRQIYGEEAYTEIHPAHDARRWQLCYQDRVAKLALDLYEGWVAACHPSRGIALVETFSIFKGMPYPDNAPLEIWVNGKGYFTIHGDTINATADPNGCDPFIETELLSPIIALEPGQRSAFEVFWHCTSLEEYRVAGVTDHAAIVRPLTIRRENQILKVSGAFGFFQVGALEIAGIGLDGNSRLVRVLGPASPLNPCSLEELVPVEDGMLKIGVRLKDTRGKLLGTVDEVLIP